MTASLEVPSSLFVMGLNKRRLTISKVSGFEAAFHCFAILVITFLIPLQAISPSLPPISFLLAGTEIKTTALDTCFTDSVNS